MAIKVLGANVSPFVRKVRVFLATKGIPYELEQVSPFQPPAGWRDKSPLGKIPVLEHDGRYINDSSVICAYLEKIQPEPALFPKDPYDYARATWLEEFMDGGVVPHAGGGIFRPLALMPVLTQKAPEPAAIAAAEKILHEEVYPLLGYLEAQLGNNSHFVGNRLSIADIAVASPFVNLRHAGYPPDAARFPKLAQFVERMHGSPAFKACIEEERPVFGKRWK
ncbi:MAG TPA: glutathione S-transferase family protein [Myxococcota bacterium]|nr:glutathione S-transferase family protein [Myxococcota bacterium]